MYSQSDIMNNNSRSINGPIGVFDSGFGGLTVLREMMQRLPEYDFVYIGDNARSPYGPRSFDVVYQYTLQAVERLFEMNCPLVVIACGTASAKALRSIQQNDLAKLDSSRRVLGVIRPGVESIGRNTKSGHVGVLATQGTVASDSYSLEVKKLFPQIVVTQKPCPMWVPLVEYDEYDSEGADYFVKKDINQLLSQDPLIDRVILGCTHYPLLMPKIMKYMPKGITVLNQGPVVAESLADYLVRHPEIESRLTRGGTIGYFTSESGSMFEKQGRQFMARSITASHIDLSQKFVPGI
jgi:glutamate racemase